MNTTTIDLTPFVSKDETRNSITKPFNDDEWTYATDGRIAIRIPTIGLQPPPDWNPPLKSIREIFATIPPITITQEMPPLPEPLTEICKDCGGTGKFIKCTECNGTGEVECNLGHEHECDRCDGSGKDPKGKGTDEPCEECDGVGSYPKQQPVKVGPAAFGDNYLRLIATLPDARLHVVAKKDVARFTFTGGDGAVMPMMINP